MLSRTSLLTLALVAPVFAQDDIDLGARIDRMFARCTKPGVPGGVVLVARGDQILHHKAYGLADLERSVPLTTESVFDIASTSKQITASSVLLLEQDGVIELGDPVRQHVSELPVCMDGITIRHLLLHTSGIPDYIGLLMKEKVDVEDRVSIQESLDVLGKVDKLAFPTGTKWAYSNSNYFLLSEVIDRNCESSMPEFAKQRIFDPLGMKSTLVRSDTRELIPNRALSFSPVAKGRWVANYSNWEQTGDGAVHTTANDLLLWLRNSDHGTVGGSKLQAALAGPGTLDDGTAISYGYGLGYGELRGRATVSHSGGWQGFRTDFLRIPSERLFVICMLNRTDMNPGVICKSIARLLLDG